MPDGSSGDDGMADPDRIGTRQEFARELTLLKERAGPTVRDVARALGIPVSTIGGYFAGRHLPLRPPGLLRKILLACGVEDEAEAEKWLAALSRVRHAPGRRPADAPVPYRGLESFQPEDAEWFYGRERLTEALVGHLRDQYHQGGLLVVVGPSGSGKSSLLRAGLIPALQSGALGIPGSYIWPVTLLTPGARPVHELAAQLASLTDDDADRLTETLLSQPDRCADLARRAAGADDDTSGGGHGSGRENQYRSVLVVDQFEETFTACQSEPERLAFIAALGAAADGDTEPAALVIVGLRADFYPHALRYPALVSALQSHQVLVGPMTRAELRTAITGPARKAGLDIEDGLVELLLRDLGPAAGDGETSAAYPPGALPLLSHALLATWDRSRGGKLTVADYRDIGGIHGAVAGTADEVYDHLTAAQQDLARQIFIRLVHVADDTADARRRVPRSELLLRHGDAQPVLDAFIDKRLITADTDDVEIAHEALLQAWPRLRDWIDNDRAGVLIHRQLTTAAQVWRDTGHDASALYGGGRLAAVQDWAGQAPHADDLNVLERDFLDASIERRRAEERAGRNRTRRLRGFVAALAALFLVAGLLAIVADQQKNTATYQRDLAISRQVATDAGQLQSTDIALAMQLSLAAYQISPTSGALASLLNATAGLAATRMLGPAGTELESVAFNPAKTMLAAGSADGTVRLWDVHQPGHPVSLGTPLAGPGSAAAVAFSPDGKILAVGSTGSAVWLWDVSNPGRPAVLDRLALKPAAIVNSVAYSPDGRTLAAASSGGQVYLWNLADPDHAAALGAPLGSGTGQVSSVTFSPNEKILAAGGSNGRIRLWELTSSGLPGTTSTVLNGPPDGVNTVAFSPDSRTLAVAGNDSDVWLWDIGSGLRAAKRPPLTGPRSWIYSVAFSPDGSTIAAGSADNNAYVWNLASGTLAATLPHPAPVLAVAYGSSGNALATADADGIARIWHLPGPILNGPEGSVFTVAFSPDGRHLAVAGAAASGNGAVQLWDVTAPGQPVAAGAPLTAAGILDGTVGYGPGGRLAAGDGNGSVQLWAVPAAGPPVRLTAPRTALNTAIQYVAFDKSGRLMAAGSTAGSIELWDTADFARTEPVAVLPADAAGAGFHDVFAVVFSPDGKLLASASADGTVRLWDIADPSRPRPLGQPLIRLASAVYQVAFSPDGQILAASGADGKVRLWDVADPGDPRLLSTLSGPIGIVYDVAFSPDGQSLATANGDKTVTLWNVADPARPSTLGSLTGPSGTVFSVAFSPAGNALAAGSQDGTTRLWLATPASAAEYVCSLAGAPITRAEWAQYIPGLPYNPPCKTQD
jgi:WD40 repeat protein/energy-coupling factor transporter ATP-binding protein EcfA2